MRKFIKPFAFVLWIVVLKAVADFYDFKVPHNTGFFSLTHDFFDMWHLVENLSLISIVIGIGMILKLNFKEWTFYLLVCWLILWIPHELILHGRIS